METVRKMEIKNKIIIVVIFSILVYMAFLIFGEIDKLLTAFNNFNWVYVPLILLLTSLNYILRFIKWDYYLSCLGINISKRDSIVLFLSGLLMSITPAKSGEVFKSYLLKRLKGTKMRKSIPIVFAERATDIFGLVILAAIGFSAFPYGKDVLFIIMTFILVTILITQSKDICLGLIDFIGRFHFVSKFTNKFYELYESAYTLFSFKNLLIAVSISVISWFFECLALFFVLKGFGTDPSLLFSIFVFSFSTIAGVISMIPGGLGVAEGSMTGLFLITGIQKAVAVSATLIIRFCTLWFGVLIGLIALYRFRTKFTEYNNKLE